MKKKKKVSNHWNTGGPKAESLPCGNTANEWRGRSKLSGSQMLCNPLAGRENTWTCLLWGKGVDLAQGELRAQLVFNDNFMVWCRYFSHLRRGRRHLGGGALGGRRGRRSRRGG